MTQEKPGLTRRDFVQYGTSAMAVLAATDLLTACGAAQKPGAQALGGSSQISYFGRFGVTEALIRDTLAVAMSRGADFADVFFQHRVFSSLRLEDGEVNRASSQVELGVGVRVVKGDQTGYGYTEDLTLASLKSAATTAAAIADGPARKAPESFRVTTGVPSRYALKVGWDAIRPQQKLPLLEGLAARVQGADPRIKKVNVLYFDEHGAILVADSTGRLVEDLQPMAYINLSLNAEQNGRRESNSYNLAGRAGLDFFTPERLDRTAKLAVERTMILFESAQPPAGEMPVVMAAGGAGILLHEAIGHGMEADFNRKGKSIYSDKLGKPIAKPFVNIVDDGTLANARGSINVDDEGNIPGVTHLVENGTLATYLHDSISAKHYGLKPTGNGRRESYKFSPMPRMRSTYMLNGPHTHDEIVASVKKGIYCHVFSNGQVDIGGGDFSFFVKNGWLIEDGKLTQPLKDVNIIGNGPKVLELVDMVGNDLKIDEGGWTCGKDGQSVAVSQGMPTVRVASITIGGTVAGKGGKANG
jgi:TldD protein